MISKIKDKILWALKSLVLRFLSIVENLSFKKLKCSNLKEIYKPGTKVKMNQKLKYSLFKRGMEKHLEKYGSAVGYVEGFIDFGGSYGEEVNVRWVASKSYYTYAANGLKIVK